MHSTRSKVVQQAGGAGSAIGHPPTCTHTCPCRRCKPQRRPDPREGPTPSLCAQQRCAGSAAGPGPTAAGCGLRSRTAAACPPHSAPVPCGNDASASVGEWGQSLRRADREVRLPAIFQTRVEAVASFQQLASCLPMPTSPPLHDGSPIPPWPPKKAAPSFPSPPHP
jgi:hypothetical protein